MSYEIEELNPIKSVLIIDSLEMGISPITLHHEVIFKNKYGSIAKMFEELNEEPTKIMSIMWDLLEDKNIFKNNYKIFHNSCMAAKEPTLDWSKKMKQCLDATTSNSFPLIKSVKRQKELAQIKNTENKKPCFAVYYDSISSRYNYTITEFYKLTLRQIHIMLKTINDKKYEELEIQAALNGVKLKPKMVYDDISEEQDEEQEEAANEAFKRLKDEYDSRVNNGK